MTESEKSSASSTEFPVATVKDRPAPRAIFLQSRMWWLTGICLLVAIVIAWQSLPETGPEITIRFPEGHGLKAGDAVRYRGIDVGVVTSVTLAETLSRVNVQVMLKPEGGRLNREGSRFWIVRPQLSLTRVTGLETAVGSKYIGVSPGDVSAPERTVFDGLPGVPPDELSSGGLQLVLRSDNRHGLDAGAPVTWRGVDVGQVLSVSLSPDARHVYTTIRISRSYRRLVRSASRFWVTSGFGVDVSFSGLKVNAQSLATIARGGVSFITPRSEADDAVRDGHVFALADQPVQEWLDKAAHVPLIDFALPETVSVNFEDSSSTFGLTRSVRRSQSGLVVRSERDVFLVTPALPVSDDSPDVLQNFELQPVTGNRRDVSEISVADVRTGPGGIHFVPLEASGGLPATDSASVRTPTEPEDCLIVRTAGSADQVLPVMEAVDREQLQPRDSVWQLTSDLEDFRVWHGAAVVAVEDGRIIGLLLNTDGGPVVAPYLMPDLRSN